jgi:hypothetical protein
LYQERPIRSILIVSLGDIQVRNWLFAVGTEYNLGFVIGLVGEYVGQTALRVFTIYNAFDKIAPHSRAPFLA